MSNTTTQQVPVAAGTTVLNEDTYNTLSGMLKSTDEGDHKMAQLILNQVDIPKSIYWIWKLAKESWNVNRMVNLRTKASRKFRDDSRLFYIYTKNETNFASFLINQNWMTPEIFSYLKDDIIRQLRSRCSNTFYSIKIELKDIHKNLDPEDCLTTLIPVTDEHTD